MRLLYLDESGKSGMADPNQPYFVLMGAVINATSWRAMEQFLDNRISKVVPPSKRNRRWEIHMADIYHGGGDFARTSQADRAAIVGAVIDAVKKFDITLMAMVIDKVAMRKNKPRDTREPELFAYEFMVERFQHYLERVNDIGIVVADEQKGGESVSRARHLLWRRSGTSALPGITRIVETVFFVPSHHSPMLQVADVAAWWCNRAKRLADAGRAEPPEWTNLKQSLDTAVGKTVGYKLWPTATAPRRVRGNVARAAAAKGG